ncbi:sesquipedalian [Anaeramoeba flamelloides]|uniref:Sesquipedalian n=1 Tax=Anaeramoeba flamelloides TaxID=1746091 RepID=A0AAV8AA45_9EUKA|nr:sesquipedalian [Anaeramoeba flamelloides]
MSTTINKDGWITKRGHFVKNWKKRWVVLRDSQLSYYKTPSQTILRGTVDVRESSVITSTFKKKHSIVLVLKSGKQYPLAFESDELKYEWADLFKKASKLPENSSNQRVVSAISSSSDEEAQKNKTKEKTEKNKKENEKEKKNENGKGNKNPQQKDPLRFKKDDGVNEWLFGFGSSNSELVQDQKNDEKEKEKENVNEKNKNQNLQKAVNLSDLFAKKQIIVDAANDDNIRPKLLDNGATSLQFLAMKQDSEETIDSSKGAQVFCVRDGKITISMGSEISKLMAGDIVVIPQNKRYTINNSSARICNVILITINGQTLTKNKVIKILSDNQFEQEMQNGLALIEIGSVSCEYCVWKKETQLHVANQNSIWFARSGSLSLKIDEEEGKKLSLGDLIIAQPGHDVKIIDGQDAPKFFLLKFD